MVSSSQYLGQNFSWGDAFIRQCANGGNTSNLTMWKQVGINHHVEKVSWDIANFYDSLNNS